MFQKADYVLFAIFQGFYVCLRPINSASIKAYIELYEKERPVNCSIVICILVIIVILPAKLKRHFPKTVLDILHGT